MESPEDEAPKPRQLPSDLPTSLNDRRSVPVFNQETEIYDAWAGTAYPLTLTAASADTYNTQDNRNS